MKKRRMYRRLTIVAVVVGIPLLLILGFYFAYVSSTANDSRINKPVTSADMAMLKQISLVPYGPSGSSMLSDVKNHSGTPFAVDGKPLVICIGADYCPYCAGQRWSLIMALMRFGNFSNLLYMTSSSSEGDYPTFTFHGNAYTSKYIVFQGFEQRDRSNQPLDTVPSNYTAVFSQFGSSYPFMNFGNRYVVPGAMMNPTPLGGQDWAAVFNDISSGNTIGTQIKESANVITALICKLTNDQPSSVCDQSPINGLTLSIAAYAQTSLGTVPQKGPPTPSIVPWAAASAVNRSQ